MRNIFIGIFLLFQFLFGGGSVFANVHNANVSASYSQNISQNSQKEIYNYKSYEHAVLRIDNSSEIYTASIKEQSGNGSSQKPDNNLVLEYQICRYKNSEFNCNSHNISSYLENEICTRAP